MRFVATLAVGLTGLSFFACEARPLDSGAASADASVASSPGSSAPDGAHACGAGLPGTDAELAATPRANEEAEWLALFVGGGFTADTPTYERVLRDLAALRAQLPAAAALRLRTPPNDLTLTVDRQTFFAMRDGTYRD